MQRTRASAWRSPRLLIAACPMASLDESIHDRVTDNLANLSTDEGVALASLSHDLSLVARRADWVAVIHGARSIETVVVFGRPAHPGTAVLPLAGRAVIRHRAEAQLAVPRRRRPLGAGAEPDPEPPPDQRPR